MRKLNLVALMAIVVADFCTAAQAADPGEAGYVFLKIGPDARSESMGGAMTGLADKLGASFYNPAALATTPPRTVLGSYNNWLTDIQAGALAGVLGVGEKGRIALMAQFMDYGAFDAFDEVGDPAPEFGASDVALAMSFAWSLTSQLAGGVTGRYVSRSMADETSAALAADLGLVYLFTDQRTRAGAAVRNLGKETKSFPGAREDDLPITLAAGLSHHLRGAPITASAEVLKPSDDDVGGAFGVEVMAVRQLFIRAGYNTIAAKIESGSSSDDLAGLNLGLGLQLDRIAIDYSFGFYSEIGDAHRFTLSSTL